MHVPIRTRQEFLDTLEQTRREAEALAMSVPGYRPFQSIAAQLGGMQSMTAGGRTPTEDERDSVSIGLIAVRELEPASEDAAMDDFIKRLHELEGYFREWPPEQP